MKHGYNTDQRTLKRAERIFTFLLILDAPKRKEVNNSHTTRISALSRMSFLVQLLEPAGETETSKL